MKLKYPNEQTTFIHIKFLFINDLYSQREFYGNVFNDKETNFNLRATELENHKYESVQLSGIIKSSCPMKGCWMEIGNQR